MWRLSTAVLRGSAGLLVGLLARERRGVSSDGRRGLIVYNVEITISSKCVVNTGRDHSRRALIYATYANDLRECVQCWRRRVPPALSGSKLLDHSQSPGPTCESCMWRGSVGPARGWSTQPLGPGYVAELRRAARRDATGARRDARVPGFYSLVHSGFCFSMNAFMPIFWSLVEKVE
jgi:hypothetical protein